MIQRPYACFGLVLIKNSYTDGETSDVRIPSDCAVTMFCTKGSMTGVDLEGTQAVIPLNTGDFVTADQIKQSPPYHRQTMHGDFELWCYSPVINNNYDPDMEKFQLAAGAATLLPIGTKLFLCSGTLTVNGSNIDGPAQIRLKSSDQSLQAVTDCYGIIFK